MPQSESVIEASNLRKAFDNGRAVLEGIDIEVKDNEALVLLGPNGSGKTVLLACLAGGLHPDGGEVSVFGKPPAKAADQLSFLLQGSLAIPELSGRETAEFYTDLHPRATDAWRDIVERFDLSEDLDRPVRDYSGGMVRKLELAVTMSVDVPLYLLDEPTVELDMTTVDLFHALLRDRLTDGRTVVMTSHLPRDARAADRLMFVRGGQIVATGTPPELLQQVPTVVTISGSIPDRQTIRDQLRAGRLFDSEGMQTGFLKADRTLSDLRQAVPETTVETRDPTYADLFNYHVHVRPESNQ